MGEKKKAYKPGHAYTETEWNEADIPPMTDEQLAQARPFAEVFPELAARMERNPGGRPRSQNPKQTISIRLDADVIARFKATGPGWQTRMNEALKVAKV
jgi:uncharacterized protein (DUF4415 family)